MQNLAVDMSILHKFQIEDAPTHVADFNLRSSDMPLVQLASGGDHGSAPKYKYKYKYVVGTTQVEVATVLRSPTMAFASAPRLTPAARM